MHATLTIELSSTSLRRCQRRSISTTTNASRFCSGYPLTLTTLMQPIGPHFTGLHRLVRLNSSRQSSVRLALQLTLIVRHTVVRLLFIWHAAQNHQISISYAPCLYMVQVPQRRVTVSGRVCITPPKTRGRQISSELWLLIRPSCSIWQRQLG